MTVRFVTGTDTGVGKTVVTAALTAILRARGRDVAVVKPAQTGVRPDEAGDVDEVRRLAGPVEVREGARLPDLLAPDRAALLAGVELPSLRDQLGLVLGAGAGRDDVLVEGAGGVTVNLGRSFGLLDLAGQVRAAGQPVTWIVVARAGLGTLNHSRLTVWAIRDRGFCVQGIVIGSWPADPGPAERHNRDGDLARHAGAPVLGVVPEGASALPPPDFQAQAPGWIRLELPVLPGLGPAGPEKGSVAPRISPPPQLVQQAPLLLGRAAPDAGVLPGVQGPAQARQPDRAAPAHLLGRIDLRQGRAERADREEQLGVQPAAGGVVTPARVAVLGQAP